MLLTEIEEMQSTEKGVCYCLSQKRKCMGSGECYQETQKNQAGRMRVFCDGFRNLTHGSFTLEVEWPVLMKFLFPILTRAVLEKQGGVQ